MSKKKKPLIGIIGGKGRMGNLFKDFFESLGLNVLISDIDTELTNIELAKTADIVIVAVPISRTVEIIEGIRDSVRKNALLCDIASLKVNPVKAMEKANSGVLGIHPLFGPLVPNFKKQNVVFCRVKDNKWVDFLREVFSKGEMKIIEMSPAEHDFQMAVIQALISFSNIGLARTLHVQRMNLKGAFLTPIFKLQSLIIGRILAQSPEMYADIEIENPFFLKVLNEFKKQIKSLAADIENKNSDGFIQKFQEVSLSLSGFRKVAQIKSSEVLRAIESQPIRDEVLGARKISGRKGTVVGFLGPDGTFSHQAAFKIFSKNVKLVPIETVKKIFQKVNDREISFGVVPIENTIGGIVPETIGSLTEYPLKVIGSLSLPIHQCLLARTDSIKDIKVIKTHHQAFAQCGGWIERNLPNVIYEASGSTTAPIIENKDEGIGFIATEIAAKIYGLKVLARNIEDYKENLTKFYLISRKMGKKTHSRLRTKKTVMIFSTYERVGILRDVLDVFVRNKINISCLHSMPSHSHPWDYFFFIEAEASYQFLLNKKIIPSLEKYCPLIRVIGAC